MIHNHMIWIADNKGDMGSLHAEFWGKISDLGDRVTFEDAVEITALEFPPRVAIKRRIS